MTEKQVDLLEKEKIMQLCGDLPWAADLHVDQTLDSTNLAARELAQSGAAAGTCVICDRQTAGRGRLGRSFYSPGGEGLYMSVILRPDALPEQIMPLSALCAVAVCDAIRAVCGVMPQIKWTNDLILGGKKLAGILTELSTDPETRAVRYAIVGIGVNVHQRRFPADLEQIAGSIFTQTGKTVSRNRLAAAILRELYSLNALLLGDCSRQMQRFAENCLTVGKRIAILRGDERKEATALRVLPDGALFVRFDDGTEQAVSCGEVSIRGMYGYI